MKILVLGNGFDIAHGLPTKYSHFLDFVKAYIDYCAGRKCDECVKQFDSNA